MAEIFIFQHVDPSLLYLSFEPARKKYPLVLPMSQKFGYLTPRIFFYVLVWVSKFTANLVELFGKGSKRIKNL